MFQLSCLCVLKRGRGSRGYLECIWLSRTTLRSVRACNGVGAGWGKVNCDCLKSGKMCYNFVFIEARKAPIGMKHKSPRIDIKTVLISFHCAIFRLMVKLVFLVNGGLVIEKCLENFLSLRISILFSPFDLILVSYKAVDWQKWSVARETTSDLRCGNGKLFSETAKNFWNLEVAKALIQLRSVVKRSKRTI